MLPVPETLGRMPSLKLATSMPRIGERVYAIGAPKGLDFTFTQGVVSQVRENFLECGSLIQHDASIGAGSSGGPLVNATGKVVGVNTLMLSPGVEAQNLNFAVPSSIVRSALKSRHYQELTQLDGYRKSVALEKSLAALEKWLAEQKGRQEAERLRQLEGAKQREAIERDADREHQRTMEAIYREAARGLEGGRRSKVVQSELARLSQRILSQRTELRIVESEGASLTEKRSRIMAEGKAVFIRLAQLRSTIAAIHAQTARALQAIQNRELAVAGGPMFLDGLNVPFDQSGIAYLRTQVVVLQGERQLAVGQGQRLGALYAGLDEEARRLLQLIEYKAAEKAKLTQELSELERQYAEVASGSK